MDKIARLSEKDRRDLFQETAHIMGTTFEVVEKDYWVVWTLCKLFSHEELRKILMFKGGTSLSKVFGIIDRFSEDIDLIIDWELLTSENPHEERSKTQQAKFNTGIVGQSEKYIEEKLLPIVSDILQPQCECSIGDNKSTININYPRVHVSESLLPHILLEIGPLASWVPSADFTITPFVAKEFPDKFDKHSCDVKAIIAERTFWEKATILHQEANRPEGKVMPLRYSRHYYDLAMMAKSVVKGSALSKYLYLLDDVVEFKRKFYHSSWTKYEDAKIGTLKLIPQKYRHKELIVDYKSMQNMIFGKPIELKEILEILHNLENEINAIN
ncbi:MAG: nucleotidyl transferase AbiEii/AbiGii toxin family protein [Candidatus Cloacimonetes bacterium]|nr:nucleotidyl transferase AbiEii/AbiGii toxin family protein [Candidatus Cloacimonadota bacterium]